MIKSLSAAAALLLLTYFIFPSDIFALPAAPTLTSPASGATVTSSKVEWQIPSYQLYSGTGKYIIWIDNNSDFSSPEKDGVYLSNNYYTPTLNPDTYYWKIKAKDSTGTWSDSSEIWHFTLTTSTSSPSPSPSTSTQTTTDTITSPSPSPNSSSPTLTTSNTPSSIDVNQQFTVNISLANFDPNTNLYLKGAFKKSGSSNYFGQTLVNNTWVKNYQTSTSQLPISTDSSGNYTGTITIKGDAADSGYTGADDYLFKVGYYQDSAISWGNEVTIHLSGSTQTSPSPTPSSSSSTSTPQSSTSKKPSSTTNLPSSKNTLPPDLLGTSIASSTAAPSSHAVIKNNTTQSNKLLFFGLALAGVGGIISIWFNKVFLYEKLSQLINRSD